MGERISSTWPMEIKNKWIEKWNKILLNSHQNTNNFYWCKKASIKGRYAWDSATWRCIFWSHVFLFLSTTLEKSLGNKLNYMYLHSSQPLLSGRLKISTNLMQRPSGQPFLGIPDCGNIQLFPNNIEWNSPQRYRYILEIYNFFHTILNAERKALENSDWK